jgi:hypothetical protein
MNGKVYATGPADRGSGDYSGNWIAERRSFEINYGFIIAE